MVSNIKITSAMIDDFSSPVSDEENKNKYLRVNENNKIEYVQIDDIVTEADLTELDNLYVHLTDDETIAGNKTFTGNTTLAGSTNISSALTVSGSATFTQTIQGTALNALWGDIAEYYETDEEYPLGTIVEFGGNKELTIASKKANAIISSEPGVILNNAKNTGQPIALSGRVPVRVLGAIKKFDEIVLSKTPGVGKKKTLLDKILGKSTIAISLEDHFASYEKLVLCATKLEF